MNNNVAAQLRSSFFLLTEVGFWTSLTTAHTAKTIDNGMGVIKQESLITAAKFGPRSIVINWRSKMKIERK